MLCRRRPSTWLALLALLVVALPAWPVAAWADGGPTSRPTESVGAGEYVPGELLVRFHPGVSETSRRDVRQRHGLQRIRELPLPGLELVRFRGQDEPPERARQVGDEGAVRYAHPNHLWAAADLAPDDPELDELWGLHNTGQPVGYEDVSGTADADIDAPEGWTVTSGSEQVVVAVIDTGVWIDHPDLVDTIWTNDVEAAGTPGFDDDGNGFIDDVHGWDFHHDDATVFDETDPVDHGTHVAGTIAATWRNATGVAGVSRARTCPASYDLDNIVSVAATDPNDALASFSNYGDTTVDLGAPGVAIYSTVPRFAKSVHVDPATAAVGYHSAYHPFGLEGVLSTTDREDLLSAALSGRMGLASRWTITRR